MALNSYYCGVSFSTKRRAPEVNLCTFFASKIYIKYAKETSNTLAMLRKHEELKILYLWAQNKMGLWEENGNM